MTVADYFPFPSRAPADMIVRHAGRLIYGTDFPKAATAIARAGGLEAWWREFDSRPRKAGTDFTTLNIVAMAACYSPDPAAPLGFALFPKEINVPPRAWVERSLGGKLTHWTEMPRGGHFAALEEPELKLPRAVALVDYHIRRNRVAKASHDKTWKEKHKSVNYLRL